MWISTSRSSWWLGDWGWPSSRPNSLVFGRALILWFVSSPFLIRSYERLDYVCLYLALDLASALLEDVAVILTPSCSHPFSDVPTLIGLRWLPSTAKTIVVRYIPPHNTPLCRCGWAGKIFFWIELRSIPPLGVICITKPIDYLTYRSHSIVLLHVRTKLYYVFHSTYIIYYLYARTRTFVRVPCTCMHLPACTVHAWLLMHATKFTVHVFLYMHSLLYIHSIGIPIGIPRVWIF